jgi:hypothetical protein
MATAPPDQQELRAAMERAVRQAMAGAITIDLAVYSVLEATERRAVSVTTKAREFGQPH